MHCVRRSAILASRRLLSSNPPSVRRKLGSRQILASSALALVATATASHCQRVQKRTFLEKRPSDDKESTFDLTKSWGGRQNDKESSSAVEFFQRVLSNESSSDPERTPPPTMPDSTSGGFQAMASGLFSILKGGGDDAEQTSTIADIVAKSRAGVEQGELHDSTSIEESFETLNQYKDMVGELAEKYVSGIDFSKLTPTAIGYYFEYEDERKNPSWKRRMHRFCPGIDMDKIEELYEALELANLSYVDTVDEIKQGLAESKIPGELVYAQVKSQPGEPAHFIAVRTDKSASWNAPLHVLMGVRGTKSLADAVTMRCAIQKTIGEARLINLFSRVESTCSKNTRTCSLTFVKRRESPRLNCI